MKSKCLVILFVVLSKLCFAQLTFNAVKTPSCNNDGSVTFTYNTGVAPYTITYANQDSSFTGTALGNMVLGLPAGVYRFDIVDGSGLSATWNTSIISTLAYNKTIVNESCSFSNGSIEIVPTLGLAPFSVQWQNYPPGLLLDSIPSGIYEGILFDANGCNLPIGTGIFWGDSLVVKDTTLFDMQLTTSAANCSNGSVVVNMLSGTPPYNFQWLTNPVQTGPVATGLPGGSYVSFFLTDATGCTEQWSEYIPIVTNIALSYNTIPENCIQGNGSAYIAALNGTPPYNYLWPSGQSGDQHFNLSAGTYPVIITDAIGCSTTQNVTVARISPIVVNTLVNPSSCTAANGSAIATATGGTPPYSFLWGTLPAQTDSMATGLAPLGNYSVLVTDAVGCTKSGFVSVPQNSTLNFLLNASPEHCNFHDGIASSFPSGGVLPYSFLWSNGANTQNISGLNSGNYTLTITDGASCIKSKSIQVCAVSPIQVSGNINPASCIFSADGSIQISVNGGLPPYSILWGNGSTGNSINNLIPDLYQVIVVDANGCVGGRSFNLGYSSISPCAALIAGKVFHDANLNCFPDLNETRLDGVWVCANANGPCKQTNALGEFSFVVPPGSYSLSHNPTSPYLPSCVSTNNPIIAAAGGIYPNNNFSDTMSFQVNHRVTKTNVNLPVTGNIFAQNIKADNLGNLNLPVEIIHRIDPSLDFVSSVPSPSSFNAANNTLTFSGAQINPSASQSFTINLGVPQTLLLGAPLYTRDSIFCSAPDQYPLNNWVNIFETVVGPYDPNYIKVNPAGLGQEGFIYSMNEELEYEIHFQNTGSYFAEDVYLTDTIDDAMIISTFEMIGSSHPCEVSLDANRLIIFRFNQINLPDSTSDPLGSCGYVRFKFKQKPNLPPGTIITGTAAIYFDYNPPVITNTARNEIAQPDGLNEQNFFFSVQPNPANDLVRVVFPDNDNYEIVLRDINGRQIFSALPKNSIQIDISSYPAGVYFLEVTGNTQRGVQKLMVTRD